MRKQFLNYAEKVFNVLVIIAFVAGAASGVFSGIAIGGKMGILDGAIQILLSWSGTLIIGLIVYSLLDIRHSLENK
jgi:hypothetical protein